MPDMTNELVMIGATGDHPVHLIYAQETDDHQPYVILTITPEFVAHQKSKQLPLAPQEFARFINDNTGLLADIVAACRDAGKTGMVLTAELSDAPHNLICTIERLAAPAKSSGEPRLLMLRDLGRGDRGQDPRSAPKHNQLAASALDPA